MDATGIIFVHESPTVALIATGLEVTVAMSVFWRVFLSSQWVSIQAEIPSSVTFAFRTLDVPRFDWMDSFLAFVFGEWREIKMSIRMVSIHVGHDRLS